jgi:hypothetical protein
MVGRRFERCGTQAVVITEHVQLEFGQHGLIEAKRLSILKLFYDVLKGPLGLDLDWLDIHGGQRGTYGEGRHRFN